MINVPTGYAEKVDPRNKDFLKLIEFFNRLEKNLEYPNSEWYSDQKSYLDQALEELQKWGKV